MRLSRFATSASSSVEEVEVEVEVARMGLKRLKRLLRGMRRPVLRLATVSRREGEDEAEEETTARRERRRTERGSDEGGSMPDAVYGCNNCGEDTGESVR